MWCIPQVDADYVARIEDVLDLYAEPPNPQRPVVCFDESPIQLIGEVRPPILPEPGQLERHDCEYQRNGTANLFVFLDASRPWRKVKVTERRAAEGLFQTTLAALSVRSSSFGHVIPRSRHDPKILWVDDAEIVGDRITKVRPIPRNLFTQKTERRIGELGASCVALVVSDVSVHEAP